MPVPSTDLRARLKDAFRWRGDGQYADPAGWWRDGALLAALAEGLAALHADAEPTIVTAIPARGFLLGPLVARELGVGFAEIRKDRKGEFGAGVLRRTTPPDYGQRDLTLALQRGVLTPGDRVLFVDDWIATGAQATAARRLVEDAGATWAGAAIAVDATEAAVRRALDVRAL